MKAPFLLISLFIVCATTLSAQMLVDSGKDQTNYQNISINRLKGATRVEELLDNFPRDKYKVVTFKVTVTGEGKTYLQHEMLRDLLRTKEKGNLFSKVIPGNKIFIEEIRVQKIKTRNAPEVWAPYSLTVTE